MSEHLYATASSIIESVLGNVQPGLVGTAGVTITNLDDTIITARSTAGIVELDAGVASPVRVRLRWRGNAPATEGEYVIAWDDGAGHTGYDRLTVNSTGEAPGIETGNDAIATLDELRELAPLDDDTKYPDDMVLATRDAVIDALEHACRVSFIRREHTETFADDVPMRMVNLDRTRAPVITAVTVDEVVYTNDDIALLRVGRGGLVSRITSYSSVYAQALGRAASITYTQGYDECPGRVARAVRLLTRDWLVENLDDAIPSRATSWSAGDNTYRLVTAGVGAALFDLPEANAVVKQYRE